MEDTQTHDTGVIREKQADEVCDIYDAIDLTHCCEGRTSYGGPTQASVLKQIADVKSKINC